MNLHSCTTLSLPVVHIGASRLQYRQQIPQHGVEPRFGLCGNQLGLNPLLHVFEVGRERAVVLSVELVKLPEIQALSYSVTTMGQGPNGRDGEVTFQMELSYSSSYFCMRNFSSGKFLIFPKVT